MWYEIQSSSCWPDQDILNFERLPSEGKLALITKDRDVCLVGFLKTSRNLNFLTHSNTLSIELGSSREGWFFFQKILHRLIYIETPWPAVQYLSRDDKVGCIPYIPGVLKSFDVAL